MSSQSKRIITHTQKQQLQKSHYQNKEFNELLHEFLKEMSLDGESSIKKYVEVDSLS